MLSEKARFRKLCSAYDHEFYAYVIELGKQFLKDYPAHVPALLIYGIALRKLARYEEARRAIQRVIKLIPKERLHLPYTEMGLLYRDKGDLEKAAHWFRKSIDACPSNAGYRIFLGGVLARKGRLKEAEKCHRQATKCSTGAIDEAYFNLGLVLRAQERYQEAMACFKKALEMDPHYKDVKMEMKDLEQVINLKGLA